MHVRKIVTSARDTSRLRPLANPAFERSTQSAPPIAWPSICVLVELWAIRSCRGPDPPGRTYALADRGTCPPSESAHHPSVTSMRVTVCAQLCTRSDLTTPPVLPERGPHRAYGRSDGRPVCFVVAAFRRCAGALVAAGGPELEILWQLSRGWLEGPSRGTPFVGDDRPAPPPRGEQRCGHRHCDRSVGSWWLNDRKRLKLTMAINTKIAQCLERKLFDC